MSRNNIQNEESEGSHRRSRSRVPLKTFTTKQEAQNFIKYATSEIIRFAFLLTDESITSLVKKVPDLSDYSDNNGLIDYSGNVNEQLSALFFTYHPIYTFFWWILYYKV